MSGRVAVLDHLDEVVAEAGLLPPGERAQVLDAAVSRLQAAQAGAVRELESSGGLTGTGCRSAGSWVRLHLRRAASGFRVTRRAAVLPSLPGFDGAFAAGQVTEEHVDTVIRWTRTCGLDAVQAHEDTLVDLAKNASARELEQALEALADMVRPDRDADKVKALAGRSFKASAVGDLVHVDAMVEPALGEALKTGAEAGARLPRGVSAADDGRTLTQRRADAFGQIVTAGLDTGIAGTAGATPSRPSDEDTEQSAAAHTGHSTDDAADTAGGRGAYPRRHRGRLRPQIALTVSTEYLARVPGAPKPLLAHFGLVPRATAERLVCDGDLSRIVLDTTTGLPLDVGKRHRLAAQRQIRALGVLFRRCAFPGCEVPFRFCEIHHRDWWCRDDGATDLDLLVPYCWTHHHFVHEYGFTVTKRNGRLLHHRPDGRLIPDPEHHLRDAVEQLTLDSSLEQPNRHSSTESRDPPAAA